MLDDKLVVRHFLIFFSKLSMVAKNLKIEKKIRIKIGNLYNNYYFNFKRIFSVFFSH